MASTATQCSRAHPSLPRVPPEADDLEISAFISSALSHGGAALERALLLFQSLPDADLHIFNERGH